MTVLYLKASKEYVERLRRERINKQQERSVLERLYSNEKPTTLPKKPVKRKPKPRKERPVEPANRGTIQDRISGMDFED